MAVKYVKDFAFDSGFGFTGSKGATPVRAYMRGGAVKKSMNEGSKKAGPKAPALAPAMVEQRSKGLGGLTPETKKLASYDKPHIEGKKGAKVPQYAKGGAVKKHVKKPMAKMMKKAEGGPVAQITEGDGVSPLQAMAGPRPPVDPVTGEYGDMMPDYEPRSLGGDLRDQYPIGTPMPVRATTPLPEEPIYVTAFDGPNIAEEDPNRYREMIAEMQRATQQPPMLEKIITKEMQPGYIRPRADNIPPVGALTPLPEEPNYNNPRYIGPGQLISEERPMTPPMRIPREPRGGFSPLPPEEPSVRIPREPRGGFGPAPTSPLARATGMLPSPLAAAARTAPQDRRAMRADRREMARDIMDRYIAGPRRAMGARGIAESRARRAMPVAPSEPMIQIPRAPRGGVMTYAKGGKVSKGEKKIGKVMGEFKRGELHSGSKQGPLVTNPKQAKAIALSEARAAGAKIPKKAMGGKACG